MSETLAYVGRLTQQHILRIRRLAYLLRNNLSRKLHGCRGPGAQTRIGNMETSGPSHPNTAFWRLTPASDIPVQRQIPLSLSKG